MKSTLRTSLALALILCLFSSSALAIATPTPPPQQPSQILNDQGIIDDWAMRYLNSKDWAMAQELREGEALPLPVLLRLFLSYVKDGIPGITIPQLAEMEPRIQVRGGEEGQTITFLAMTADLELSIKINAKTGVLLNASFQESGGNG